jgi:MoaA/NifB/PqqE/SkfB family radical SAM enzyme
MNLVRKFKFYFKTGITYIRYKLGFPSPYLVVLAPTYLCNLKCSYCNRKAQDKRILSFNKIRSIVDQISESGASVLSISGGEPLFVKNIDKIGRYAIKKGLVVNLNTNATLITEENVNKIANSFDYIRISLDGNQNKHDFLSGVQGSYKKVINAINLLNGVKKRTAKIGLNVLVSNSEDDSFLDDIKSKVDFVSLLPKFDFHHNDFFSKNDIYANNELTKDCGAGNLYFFIGLDTVAACPLEI